MLQPTENTQPQNNPESLARLSFQSFLGRETTDAASLSIKLNEVLNKIPKNGFLSAGVNGEVFELCKEKIQESPLNLKSSGELITYLMTNGIDVNDTFTTAVFLIANNLDFVLQNTKDEISKNIATYLDNIGLNLPEESVSLVNHIMIAFFYKENMLKQVTPEKYLSAYEEARDRGNITQETYAIETEGLSLLKQGIPFKEVATRLEIKESDMAEYFRKKMLLI
ncbi:hypothetical protein SK355_02370 [Candidatus Fukatsuia symbiotica]|uniref:Uncharacterized protein n=1 Tax=Candidatus Fukatsuia symbiotica TaxID=1878942 RepID=A0A2Y9CKD0_9GAMM|nr:hypothetical protein [Candidatus Fukatsuia symbiotica]AWK13307.1 hypothetical protein CCS41_00445 [Candidatus Fukatsuia symbiotica]MEA9444183.1 hypothetical protein [Candidatus Fukatsuia symbiotica]